MIGIGNAWRGDDGAGPAVAAALGGKVTDDPAGLIVVDASRSGAEPGTVHRFDASAGPLPAGATRCSTHAFGVAEAIELARVLDRLPARLDVYAIEGAAFGQGEGLSAAVERAVAGVARELAARHDA